MLPQMFGAVAPGVTMSELGRAFALGSLLSSGYPWPYEGLPGYRLFWVLQDQVGFRDLPARAEDYLIVGRHTCCDLVLPADPQISLRHLLARAQLLADGTVALRLLDLHTNLPMFLEDGVPRRSIVASGALVARVGGYVIGALPFGQATKTELGPYRSPPPYVVCEAQSVPRGGIPRLTHITSLPPAPGISDVALAQATEHDARITLGFRDRGTSVTVSPQALELGVLLGRAPKCLDEGLQSILHTGISRAHLLLLRQGDVVHAFDLCSMQGTYHEGARARRVELAARGTRLELGAFEPVTFLWHSRTLH